MTSRTCTGSQATTKRPNDKVACPVCLRVQATRPDGRIVTHSAPKQCIALVYKKGWPDTCSRNAIAGSRYCRQHTEARA